MWSRKILIETNKTVGCDTYGTLECKPDLLDFVTSFKVQGDDIIAGCCFFVTLSESSAEFHSATPLSLTSVYDLTMINWDIREICGLEKYS